MIQNIKMKNGMDEILSTTGVVTEDGKFVVAAQGRFVKDAKWNTSRKGNGTEFRIPMRLDMSISHMNGEEQGDFLFPYISGRVLHLKGSFGSRLTVVTPFDNESRNQYKNAVVDAKIFAAMKDAIKFAITDATERAQEGRAVITASSSEYIDNADAFLEMSEKLIGSLAGGADTSAGMVESADDVAAQVLGV
jgi:hypothetical protein